MTTFSLLGIEAEVHNDYAGNVATVTRGIFRATVSEHTPEYKAATGYGARWVLGLAIGGSSMPLAEGTAANLDLACQALNDKAGELARETIAIAEL
jgi:hypothetical protein